MTDTQATKYFILFAFLHLILWTFIPALVSPHAPLDVIEGYAWGHEFLIGTHKHPPMQSWLLEIFAIITNRASFAHFLASQIAIIISFWAVWDIGKRISTPATALAAVLLLEMVVYYNFVSTEFNPNILQIMFWALIAHAFYNAIQSGKIIHWALLGIWAAGGIYSKYYTVFFLLSLAALMLFNIQARKKILTAGPYIALAICTALLAPHIIWLVQHDFLPMTYTQSRIIHDEHGLLHIILEPIIFTASQIGLLLPMIIMATLLCGFKRNKNATNFIQGFDKDFLVFVTFGPLLLTCLLSLAFGLKLKNMWGASFWNFSSLWLLLVFFGTKTISFRKRFIVPFLMIAFALPIFFGISTYMQPYWKKNIKRVHFPGQELAEIVTQEWEKRYQIPLSYVIGDTWVAGSISYYAPSRPSLFLENNPVISHWIDPDHVAHKGGIFVVLPCHRPCHDDIYQDKARIFADTLRDTYPQAEIQKALHLHAATKSNKPKEIVVFWAIIPPATAPVVNGASETESAQ